MLSTDLFRRQELATASWSVLVRDLAHDRTLLSHDPDRRLRTASVAKIFVLVELAERLERGEVAPGLLLDRRRSPQVADSGLWQHLTSDELPVVDVARLVGSVSDNLATNVLVDLLGLERVQARAREWTGGAAMLHDYVRDARDETMPPTLSEGSAAAWVDVLARLHREADEGGGPARRVLDWLATGTDLSMVASAFGLDPLAHTEPDRGLMVWSKTGTDSTARADVGLVTAGGRSWAYAVLCTWEPGSDDGVRDVVLAAMREIGLGLRAVVAEHGEGVSSLRS